MEKIVRKKWKIRTVRVMAYIMLAAVLFGSLEKIGWTGSDLTVLAQEETEEKQIGTYSVDSDWVKIEEKCEDEIEVYRKTGYEDLEETSEITCSYVDTNYAIIEYEQLRDMLTNNLMYSNVNAQISTNAGYTEEKDYLYTLIADDKDKPYKDIYYYVVGDYRCFCVSVREYRVEKTEEQEKMPQEIGKKIAADFIWNSEW